MKQAVVLVVILLLIGTVWYFFGKEPTPAPSPTPSPSNLISLTEPVKDALIASPLHIAGQARGQWYFEGTFQMVLADEGGKIISLGKGAAQGEWMTEEYVPFSGDIEFEVPPNSAKGKIILIKANPSGLPENDNTLEIPIRFQ